VPADLEQAAHGFPGVLVVLDHQNVPYAHGYYLTEGPAGPQL
jgi:hypothetical protein